MCPFEKVWIRFPDSGKPISNKIQVTASLPTQQIDVAQSYPDIFRLSKLRKRMNWIEVMEGELEMIDSDVFLLLGT